MKEWPLNPRYNEAMERLQAGEIEESIPLFLKAMEAQPDRPRILSNMAFALYRLGRTDEAIETAEKGVEMAGGSDLYVLNILADIHLKACNHKKALSFSEQILGRPDLKDNDRVTALENKAWALLGLDRGREALSCAQEALGLNSNVQGVWVALGSALAECDRWGEARKAVDQAISLDPGDEDGDLARRGRLISGAMEKLEQILIELRDKAQRTPSEWEGWHAVGTLLFQLGRLEEAERTFDRSRRLHPEFETMEDCFMLSHWEADCRLALLSRFFPKDVTTG